MALEAAEKAGWPVLLPIAGRQITACWSPRTQLWYVARCDAPAIEAEAADIDTLVDLVRVACGHRIVSV
jgi:hypothetical protein